IGTIILIAIFTNPNQDRHKEVIRNKFNTIMQKSFKEEKKGENEVAQALGLMLGGALAGSLLDNLISTDNYLLFSTTKMMWEGETKVIGIGAFGNVFLLKDFEKVMEDK